MEIEKEFEIRQLAIDLVKEILQVEKHSFAYGCSIGGRKENEWEKNKNEMLKAELEAERLVNKLRDVALGGKK